MTGRPNIVPAHGAWADGSCWTGVIERLQEAGYSVHAPQFPSHVAMVSHPDEVAGLIELAAESVGATALG